jgi:hypothetical protein
MTREEASELAKRIINCWRGGPPLAEWTDELQRLDAGQAGTAYVRLKRELENAPSIARFIAEYRALNTHDGGNVKPKCGWCSDGGWIPTQRHEFKGGVYSGVEPCTHCPTGAGCRESQTWRTTGMRHFVSDAEAERIIAAAKARAA